MCYTLMLSYEQTVWALETLRVAKWLFSGARPLTPVLLSEHSMSLSCILGHLDKYTLPDLFVNHCPGREVR